MTETTRPKLRYPAAVFRFLRRYPVRHCDHCGKQLTPRLLDGNKLETRQNFEKRKTCDKTCWAAFMTEKRRARREERITTSLLESPGTPIPASFILQPELAKQGVTTIEQADAMTDDEQRVLPRVTKAKLKMLRSQIAGAKKVVLDRTSRDDELLAEEREEPSTLTDPAYGGPPAPAEVVEEVAPALDQVIEQVARQAGQVESDPEVWRPGELQVGTLIADWIPEARKDLALNRPVRPVKLPSATPPQRAPVPPPSLQAKLPDPRPQTAPYTVIEGEVIERGDYATCPNEGCGERLNAFGKCRNCEQRAQWLKGQRAKVGAA